MQTSMGNDQGLTQLLAGGTPQGPLGNPQGNLSNPWPITSHGFGQSLSQRDPLSAAAGAAALMSPHGLPPDLRQQALQKLQQQQQQGVEQSNLLRGMSGELPIQPGSSRQSSGTMQRNFQSSTLPEQHSQLNTQQLLLLQQHFQVCFLLLLIAIQLSWMKLCMHQILAVR